MRSWCVFVLRMCSKPFRQSMSRTVRFATLLAAQPKTEKDQQEGTIAYVPRRVFLTRVEEILHLALG